MDSITVTAARPHSNEFGETREKAVGDSYDVPTSVAESLLASGWVEKFEGATDENANGVSRGKATGKGAGAA